MSTENVLEFNDERVLVEKEVETDLESVIADNKMSRESDESVYITGQMVQLSDGSTAFLEHSSSSANETYTPLKLENGNIIYVSANSILHNLVPDKVTELHEDSTQQNKDENRTYECTYDYCNKSYSSLHYLKVHLRGHTGDKPFKCVVEGCNKSFSTKFGLKTHNRTHNNERPYVCTQDNCEKRFKTSGDLQKHIRTHTGERPFVCPVPECGRSFTTCNICKVHIRTHTGERPYKCTYANCNKTFSSVTNHRNHLRIHSGEKPYVCSIPTCNRRFTEYSSLYKHNMVHSRESHTCSICKKTYKQASSLSVHMRTSHVKESQTCQIYIVDCKSLEEEGVVDDNSSQQLFSELEESEMLNV